MDQSNLYRHRWKKSSYSNGQGGDCVEVSWEADIGIRDSKNPGREISVSENAWARFLIFAKRA